MYLPVSRESESVTGSNSKLYTNMFIIIIIIIASIHCGGGGSGIRSSSGSSSSSSINLLHNSKCP
jgi:hypothetical protein